MKKSRPFTLPLIAALALWAGSAFAQPTNHFTNNVPSPGWWTNYSQFLTNLPPQFTNRFSVTLPPGVTNVPPSHPQIGSDARTLVQQFQTQREALINQLKGASQQDREALVNQLRQLTDQLKDQLADIREQAQQQAESMRQRFQDNRDRGIDQAAGTPAGNRGRLP